MGNRAGAAAGLEVLLVLALAGVGLLLVGLVAFAPWYPERAQAPSAVVVELHSPTAPPLGGLTAADAG